MSRSISNVFRYLINFGKRHVLVHEACMSKNEKRRVFILLTIDNRRKGTASSIC